MAHPTACHRIFLLSVWREDEESEPGPPKLRFRLEDPRTGQQQVFASLEMLLAAVKTTLLKSMGEFDLLCAFCLINKNDHGGYDVY